MKPLMIRSDASPEIGTGHIMRCLALAEAWQDTGGEVVFILAYDTPAMEARLKKEGFRILHISQKSGTIGDADETALIAHEHGADWIVVDGYHFGAEYQKTIKDAGLCLLFIDDYGHANHYFADIVLNQNIYADMSFYQHYEPYTRFLLGMKYVLLRKEFLQWSGWHRDIPEAARKILVTLGGSDPDNVTLKITEAVKTVDLDGLEVVVVVGGTNLHFDLIHETVKDLSNFTLIKNAENMPELMAWADIAITAGGSTCWELAFMGVPCIIITLAENQKLISKHISQKISCINLGSYEEISIEKLYNAIYLLLSSFEKRLEISQKAQRLVDGEGANLIVKIILT